MKFKSKVDILMLLGYFVFLAFGGFLVFESFSVYLSGGTANFIFSLAFLIVGSVLLCYAGGSLFNTYYEFKDKTLYVHSGFFKTEVPYIFIMNLKHSKSYFTYNCLSIKKLKITYRDGSGTSKIHVSPKNQEEFIKLIRLNCKSCKIEDK